MSTSKASSSSRETTPVPSPDKEEEKNSSTTQQDDKSPLLEKEQDSSEAMTEGETEASPEDATEPSEPPKHAWQAIFSPPHNAYYFYNSETQETTWVNPLEPSASTSTAAGGAQAADGSVTATTSSQDPSSTSPTESSAQSADTATSSETAQAATSHYAALQQAALAQGIDPALAYLDPSLLSSIPGQAADKAGLPVFTAKFNRHTGAFARPDARAPSHLSEHERAKRMSEFYFDVGKWEEDLAKQGGSARGAASAEGEWEDDGQGGRKRKRPSKKELESYKEKKKAKKLAKTAWLRN